MITIWNTSSSRVYINGQDSEPFPHKRGLRQGDPLSPMLFNIAVDVFQRMVKMANETLDSSLSNKLADPIFALQYADDTAIIASADISTLITFKLILRLFTSISGLQVNFAKSSFIPINTQEDDRNWITVVLGFSRTSFLINYLSMPLSIKRPSRASYLPLIEKIKGRLQGWQSRLLSRGGQMELVQTVLSTIPIYHMTCFLLPQWVIHRIDKVRRSFLWGKSSNRGRSISLCNWEQATTPKEWGGLGLADLHKRNMALLLRWWWKGYKEPDGLWGLTVLTIRWQGHFQPGPILWSKRGSFFWGQLLSLKHLFDWSISWSVGDGTSISYWYDKWGAQVLKLTGTRCINHSLSLQQASLMDSVLDLEEIHLIQGQQDVLMWN